jgi:hypothetical protein
MNFTKTLGQEALGLFVDDGRLALAVLIWLAIVWLGLPYVGLLGITRCMVLFAGVALILAENFLRQIWPYKRSR